MAYPPYPVTPPSAPPAPPPAPPPWPPYTAYSYGYARPRPRLNPLVYLGAILTSIGGLVFRVGWLVPSDFFDVVIGVGWLAFGPGLGVGLVGIAQQRSSPQ